MHTGNLAPEDLAYLQAQLDEAQRVVVTLREQLDAVTAECARRVDEVRQRGGSDPGRLLALNAELVEDLRVVAARCGKTLELAASPAAAPYRAALTLLQVLAETAADAGAAVLPVEVFDRSLEVEIPRSDKTPALLVRVMVLPPDVRSPKVSVETATEAWDTFRYRFDQEVDRLMFEQQEHDQTCPNRQTTSSPG